jgi:hypothetical protein
MLVWRGGQHDKKKLQFFEFEENQIPHAIFENKTKELQINLLKKFQVNCLQMWLIIQLQLQ